jgi:NAD+ synthase (glutamine-hydrolysing)
MIYSGFFKVAAAIPEVRVADCEFNILQIKKLILNANQQQVKIVCFPELSVTAYTCGDLFLQETLIDAAEKNLQELLSETAEVPVCFIVGVPLRCRSKLYNCAVVCKNGNIDGIVPKRLSLNHSKFIEKRWFESYPLDQPPVMIDYAGKQVPFGTNLIFDYHPVQFAVEICEDFRQAIQPGVQLIFNPSANEELVGKQRYIKSLISRQSAKHHVAFVH